jgi:NADPH:quinone reductase-like Zn-dependent oxidoreductase
MRAVIAEEHGGPEVLKGIERDGPTAGPGQVLVDVVAAGINFADIKRRQRQPPYCGDVPHVPGMEGAGIVAAVGPGNRRQVPARAGGPRSRGPRWAHNHRQGHPDDPLNAGPL